MVFIPMLILVEIRLIFIYHPRLTSKLLVAYSLQFIAWCGTLLYWGTGTTLGLLQPLGPYLFYNYGSVLDLLSSVLNIDYVGLSRSLLLSSHLFIIYLLHRHEASA